MNIVFLFQYVFIISLTNSCFSWCCQSILNPFRPLIRCSAASTNLISHDASCLLRWFDKARYYPSTDFIAVIDLPLRHR